MLTRRRCLLSVATLATAAPLLASDLAAQALRMEQCRPFDLHDVQVEAIKLSGGSFERPQAPLPPEMAKLDYDGYRRLRFRPETTLWADTSTKFRLQFFPMGFLYDTPVRINIVRNGCAEPVRFAPEMFDFAAIGMDASALPDGLAFAGMRFLYPLNQTDSFNEFMVFLGASFFRMLGREQRYGLSARGLAIGTGEDGPEEFPFFREFWIEQPEENAHELLVYALLDSESITGAYRFLIRPGNETAVDVTMTLFPRREIAKLGIAPITSMFLMGENQPGIVDDFRPEVHDSDGLLIANGQGEWLYRPLVNPPAQLLSGFHDRNPREFGLLQRDRDFASYQDLEARYHLRPSLWIEPQGAWGPGMVQLLELPTGDEYHDNIAAFWVPQVTVERGQRLEWSYRLTSHLAATHPLGHVEATRSGPSPVPGARRFFVDFSGPNLKLLTDRQDLIAEVSASRGRIAGAYTVKNDETRGWRVFFDYVPEPDVYADLRCHLHLMGQTVTETWLYPWVPPAETDFALRESSSRRPL